MSGSHINQGFSGLGLRNYARIGIVFVTMLLLLSVRGRQYRILGFGCEQGCGSGSGFCGRFWIRIRILSGFCCPFWIRIRILWSVLNPDPDFMVSSGSGSGFCGRFWIRIRILSGFCCPFWIRIRILWSVLDPDPDFMVSSGSGSGFYGQFWIRILWLVLDLNPDFMVVSGSGSVILKWEDLDPYFKLGLDPSGSRSGLNTQIQNNSIVEWFQKQSSNKVIILY